MSESLCDGFTPLPPEAVSQQAYLNAKAHPLQIPDYAQPFIAFYTHPRKDQNSKLNVLS